MYRLIRSVILRSMYGGRMAEGACARPGVGECLSALRHGDFHPEMLEVALTFRGEDQEALFELARQARERAFPDRTVEVRSVIEMSNICRQGCRYCNMGKGRKRDPYVIEMSQFLELITHIYECGRRVFLIQSGENPAPSFIQHVGDCIAAAKEKHPDLVLILCMGNLSREQYAQLKEAGATRYILKFETSNAELYHRIKPYDTLEQRLRCLETLLDLGYEVGSGNIVGLPGQTTRDLINDLAMAKRYTLTMSSCTTFIPAEDSELRNEPIGNIDLTLNMMALIRIMNPDRLMPTTSSLEKARAGGQVHGLMAGANTVTIHDGTPERFKSLFPIYSVSRVTPNPDYMKDIVEKAGLKMPVY